LQEDTDILEEHAAYTFKVKGYRSVISILNMQAAYCSEISVLTYETMKRDNDNGDSYYVFVSISGVTR
jgi:hypothetical protein